MAVNITVKAKGQKNYRYHELKKFMVFLLK